MQTNPPPASSIDIEKTTKYVLKEQVGHLLRRANQRHSQLFADVFKEFELTGLQFAVIMALSDFDELSQNHLGRETAMDPNTVKGVVERLFERGVLIRRKSEVDQRRFILQLSEKGLELANKLKIQGELVTTKTLEPLSPEEQSTLLELLKRLS